MLEAVSLKRGPKRVGWGEEDRKCVCSVKAADKKTGVCVCSVLPGPGFSTWPLFFHYVCLCIVFCISSSRRSVFSQVECLLTGVAVCMVVKHPLTLGQAFLKQKKPHYSGMVTSYSHLKQIFHFNIYYQNAFYQHGNYFCPWYWLDKSSFLLRLHKLSSVVCAKV